MGIVVTIDGPAASGKSSVSRELARRLGWKWVSTGAFYRGLAFAALQLHIELDDVKSLSELSQSDIWQVTMNDDMTRVYFKDQDVTEAIGHEDVGSFASRVSSYPGVRKALLENQRECSANAGLVAEGRDCGTVVFPQAEVKIYLTANSQNRAQRRAAEQGTSAEEIAESQKIRDQQDSTRKTAPLQVPENAHVIDTTTMNLEQVVNTVEAYVRLKIQL